MRVLVVDRNPLFALALAEYFDERGWELTTARDAARALDRVGGPPRPNLIVLDLDLPEGEGMVLLQLLKTAPSTRFIPVVAVTGSGRREVEDRARAAGAVECARKPLPPACFDAFVGALATAGETRAQP